MHWTNAASAPPLLLLLPLLFRWWWWWWWWWWWLPCDVTDPGRRCIGFRCSEISCALEVSHFITPYKFTTYLLTYLLTYLEPDGVRVCWLYIYKSRRCKPTIYRDCQTQSVPKIDSQKCFIIISITARNFEAKFLLRYRQHWCTYYGIVYVYVGPIPSLQILFIVRVWAILRENFSTKTSTARKNARAGIWPAIKQPFGCFNFTMTGSLKWYDIVEPGSTLQKIRNDLPQKPVAKDVQRFTSICVDKAGGCCERSIWRTFYTSLVIVF